MTSSPPEKPLDSKPEERRFVLKLLALLLVLMAAFWTALSWRGGANASRFPRVKLSDGTWLVARSVTVGTKHAIEIPFPLEMQLSRWQRNFTQATTTQHDRMLIWLTRENDRGEALDLKWFARAELAITEDFTISASNYHTQHQVRNGNSGSGTGDSGFSDAKTLGGKPTKQEAAVAYCDFPIIRPQPGKLRLNVYDGSKSVIAVLEIPYPKLPTEPIDDWQVDSLPVTRSAGNLDVTLKSVEFHKYGYENAIQARPQFEFVHDGQPSNTWMANSILIDPLGNQTYAWRANLSPLESVWKLDVTLTQYGAGRFLPEEVGKLPPLTLTPAKELVLNSATHTINGAAIQLIGLGGPGPSKFTLPNSNSTVTTTEYKSGDRSSGMGTSCSGNVCEIRISTGHPFLLTTDSYSQSGSVQMRAFDQDGAALESFASSTTNNVTFWFFEPKPTSTSVVFQFIVQKPRHVEFFITPPQPSDIKHQQN